ncbi:hypothetical protein BRETT_000165 [Brettanomyces bruxellensis]|uniref:Vacuolar protein sorting-associated protein 27 n=1 Tax=Dekkera bruxellensis TaxID=5007 RepID=A0A871R420_DEKBR|nr:uncharacterized protein BRETT_000165 [Brettanomyces bruxellensis]QOU18438.1 hypothetical protein BRETT_000165 [Brettanomyces bruxellensis]
MSWFGSSETDGLDPIIERATSETIPNGDIDFGAALELSDRIRSKQIPPKDAMRSLKKRFLSSKDPNKQKSSLKLIDFCIKNGGEHFLLDISSKEFMDPFIGILHDKNLNGEVKQYLLELIQSWSIMFSTHPKLSYVNDVYKKLQGEKFKFPDITEYVDSSLIESKVAPEWEDSDACMLCSKLFSFINRKHHCRSCGGVFCQEHSSQSCELPELGITVPVRVCDTCYQEHMDKLEAQKKTSNKKSHKKHKSNKASSKYSIGNEDDDLKKAIELSLQEAGMTPEATTNTKDDISQPPPYEDEDAAMKAAIEASLQDLHQQEKPISSNNSVKQDSLVKKENFYSNMLPSDKNLNTDFPAGDNVYNAAEEVEPARESIDDCRITGKDENNLLLFVKTINTYLKTNPQQRIPLSKDITMKQMYSDVVLLQPKVEQNLTKYTGELERYQDLYSKIFAINKIYNEMLQQRSGQQVQQRPPFDIPQANPWNSGTQIPNPEHRNSSIPQDGRASFSNDNTPSYHTLSDSISSGGKQTRQNTWNSQLSGTNTITAIGERPQMPLPAASTTNKSELNIPSSPYADNRKNSFNSIDYAPLPEQATVPVQKEPSMPDSAINSEKDLQVTPTEEKPPQQQEPVNLIDL